ncbi:hypothetical protein [Baekduia sp.]|uniref:hypothetical protein n=1 Tax=Baekduia sp. TaxID=2600305 RepID=UPI002DFC387E|nr:hypothetical protein [Baekduia sp.]
MSKKGALLFASAVAVCAFALPAMASAATWHGPFPSTHVFDTLSTSPSQLTATSGPPNNFGWDCGFAQLHVDILSPTDAKITNFGARSCHGTGADVNCTVTLTPQRLPWTLTNPTTHTITIDGLHITVLYENTPGNPTACALPGTETLTGDLRNGTWTNAGHEFEFTNAPGLLVHRAGMSIPFTITGTFFDTSGNLTMTD